MTSLLLILLAQAAAGGSAPVTTLACDLPDPAAVADKATQRIFQVGPGSLREWNADEKAFGPNRCELFACTKSPDRAEGAVSSASVSYTIGVDYRSGQGYWRVTGASGLRVSHGDCRIVPSPAAPRTGSPAPP